MSLVKIRRIFYFDTLIIFICDTLIVKNNSNFNIETYLS